MKKLVIKMNAYLIMNDVIKPLTKENKLIRNLFLSLSNNKKQFKMDDCWKEVKDCLLKDKVDKNIKVYPYKDLKFTTFSIGNNQSLVFAIGDDKLESLKYIVICNKNRQDIYQETNEYFLLKSDTKIDNNKRTLYRIHYKDGSLGGWIDDIKVFDASKGAKIYGNAVVCRNARVYDNAEIYGETLISSGKIFGNAIVHGDTFMYGGEIYDNAEVDGESSICDNAKIYGNAKVRKVTMMNNAQIYGNSRVYNTQVYENAQVYDNARVSGVCLRDSVKVYKNADISGNTSLPAHKLEIKGDEEITEMKIIK